MADRHIPFALFITEDKESTLVIPHIVMVRWDDKDVPSLLVYFKAGPHIELLEEDGKRLERELFDYWSKVHERR